MASLGWEPGPGKDAGLKRWTRITAFTRATAVMAASHAANAISVGTRDQWAYNLRVSNSLMPQKEMNSSNGSCNGGRWLCERFVDWDYVEGPSRGQDAGLLFESRFGNLQGGIVVYLYLSYRAQCNLHLLIFTSKFSLAMALTDLIFISVIRSISVTLC